MVWQPEIDELNERKELAYNLGGEERVQKHIDNGKLTVRDRIATIADENSFQERGVLAGKATYEENELIDFRPSNYVMGLAKIDGRRVSIGGDDFTVRGGAADGAVGDKKTHQERMALELRIPIVRLVDGTGGGGSVKTIEDIGRTYLPGGPGFWETANDAMEQVPVVAAAMGSVAGIGAARVAVSHFSVIVKGTGQVFTAGPPVVERGLGMWVDKEDLGGAEIHAHGSGVCDNEAVDELDAFEQMKKFLSYLPSSSWEIPPHETTDDSPIRRDEELLSIIPRERRQPHIIRKLITHVIDHDSFFEIGKFFGRSVVTCLGRIDGFPVAIIANDPMAVGGSLDTPGSEKMLKFIDLADTFNLPIINLVDQPGFMIGVEAEKAGVIKAGVRALQAIYQCSVPWATVVVRRAYGVAGAAHQNHSNSRWPYRISWPSGDWGSLPIEGGVMAAYRRDIEAADDPESYRQEIEDRLNLLRSPFRTAESFNIEDIVDPRDTRPLLVEWIHDAYQVLSTSDLGPKGRGMRA